MMSTSIDKTRIILMLFAVLPGLALEASADEWQERMLFNPTASQLEMERTRDRITIYEGMKDTQVARAMDEQFERIEHMMFVRTIVTDENGAVKTDPDSGEVNEEDDGC
jgi:hypothetical protein